MVEVGTSAMQAIENRRVGEFRRFIRVMFGRRLVIFGTAMVLVLILTAILAPVLSPYDPNEPNMKAVLKMPSREHLLGTDELGRDFLSRVIYGSRVSLMVGIVAVIIAAGIGVGLGLISGFYGGWTDIIIMRCIDALLALPPLVLMMAISAVLGGA